MWEETRDVYPFLCGKVPRVKLEMVPGIYSVCRLSPDSALPRAFFSATRTNEELSVVCLEQDAPMGARIDSGWRGFRVAGTLDFGLTGILNSLAAPLAEAAIPIFAVSTFDTDYILVKEMEKAREALLRAGHDFT